MYLRDLKVKVTLFTIILVSLGVAYSIDKYYFFQEGSCFANNTITSLNDLLRKFSMK